MKLRGISDAGFKRLAQSVNDGGPPYSGSRDALLENTAASLAEILGEEFSVDEVREWVDSINNTPSGESVVRRRVRRELGIRDPELLEGVMTVLAWAAHEMLDYDFKDEME